MFFSSLAELFHSNTVFSQIGMPQQDILYTCFYPSNIGRNNAEIIGIGETDNAPTNKSEDVDFPNLILLGKEVLSIPSNLRIVNYLHLNRTDLFQTREDVSNAILLACRQSDQIINLLRTRTNNHSFSDMLSLAANSLSLSLFLTDVSGQVVNCSRISYSASWDAYIDTIPGLKNKSQYRAMLSHVLRTRSAFSCEGDSKLSAYACPITRHDVISNIIIAVSENHPLSSLDHALLHEISLFFSKVAPNLPLQIASNDMLSYLLQLLLLHPNKKLSADDELILARKGWHKNHRYCVYYVQFLTDTISSSSLDNWQQILSYHFPQAFIVEKSNSLYMIYNLTTYTKLRRKEVMHKILDCLNLPFTLVGASSSCQNIEQLYSARLFSEMAIDIGKVLDPSLRAFEYDRYGIYHLLMTSSEDLDNLIHPLIRLLVDYDKENKTEYTNTLFEYLKANMKPGLAAKKLCIHKNTLDYRIRRIHEISHPRLEDPERVMAFLVSFAVLTFQAKQEAFLSIKEKYSQHD